VYQVGACYKILYRLSIFRSSVYKMEAIWQK
jgi:hypothetical protein